MIGETVLSTDGVIYPPVGNKVTVVPATSGTGSAAMTGTGLLPLITLTTVVTHALSRTLSGPLLSVMAVTTGMVGVSGDVGLLVLDLISGLILGSNADG